VNKKPDSVLKQTPLQTLADIRDRKKTA